MAVIGISGSCLFQGTRALHKIASERGNMLIPLEYFGGKSSIGSTYALKGGRGQREYTEEFHRELLVELYENNRLFEYERSPAPGAKTVVGILKSHGHDIKVVVNMKRTPQPYVRRWWDANNFPKGVLLEFVRNGGEGASACDHYQNCDVVIDTNAQNLLKLRKSKGPKLLHMLPEPGGVGSRLDYGPTLRGVQRVHGWARARPVLEEFSLAMLAA